MCNLISHKNKKNANFIEIETFNEAQAIKAASKFKELKCNVPCLIMLDNMKPNQIKKIVRKLKKNGLYKHVLIEASGGITPKDIKDYAKTGVDVISMGYLTTASHSLNIKLKILFKS